MTFRAAKCPACGADIQVPADRDTIKCMYCGKDIVVRDAVRAVAGPTVQNLMRLAEAAEAADNHEEAYVYFTRVLELEPTNAEAWFGKAVAAGWGSTLSRDRYPELLAGIERAIEFASDDLKDDLRKRGALAIASVTLSFFTLSNDHKREFIALRGTWDEHVGRCIPMIFAIRAANRFDPTSRSVIEAGIFISKSLIEGVEYHDPYATEGHDETREEHLSTQLEAEMQKMLDEFVAKMQALDPTYKGPKIDKAGSSFSVVGCLGSLIGLAVLGYGAWWVIKTLFFRD